MPYDVAAAPSGIRRRNAVLEALELFRKQADGVRLSTVVAFLYLCENEGLCISELAAASGMTLATASRAARSLVEPEAQGALAPALGLAELRRDGKVHALYLTTAGAALRARLNATIVQATPIF